jgi:hypothetical protein
MPRNIFGYPGKNPYWREVLTGLQWVEDAANIP